MNGNKRSLLFMRFFGFVAAAALLAGWWSVARSQAGMQAKALPAPGKYVVDPDHSFVYFSAWHHIVGLVRGRFDKVGGTITAAANPADCAVDITIETASINTQNSERDEDLRSPAYFNVKQFPTATYQGRGIRPSGDEWVMDGTLTIRGISKVVPLTFVFKGVFPDTPASKPGRASFHGTAGMHRGDFGMTRDNATELGVPPVPGTDVNLEIDVEADPGS
jgi:polyisoprenoid-binding protein YceI